MKTLAIGDIHGRYEALKQVLSKSKFDYEHDKLIILGDIVDGGEKTRQCVNELLKIKNKVFILGNHDQWFMKWMDTGDILPIWWHQGGLWTVRSYGNHHDKIPVEHVKFFRSAILYHIENEMLFVHGGMDPSLSMENQEEQILLWDRSLITYAEENIILNYNHVFVGHTTTQFYGETNPITLNNLTMLDTGGGWNGRLTVMDINTKEYWQSDIQKPCDDKQAHYHKVENKK